MFCVPLLSVYTGDQHVWKSRLRFSGRRFRCLWAEWGANEGDKMYKSHTDLHDRRPVAFRQYNLIGYFFVLAWAPEIKRQVMPFKLHSGCVASSELRKLLPLLTYTRA